MDIDKKLELMKQLQILEAEQAKLLRELRSSMIIEKLVPGIFKRGKVTSAIFERPSQKSIVYILKVDGEEVARYRLPYGAPFVYVLNRNQPPKGLYNEALDWLSTNDHLPLRGVDK